MAGADVLLIDLENFFLSREEDWLKQHPSEKYECEEDLKSLLGFAEELADGRRLIVRRAYANFNDRRQARGGNRYSFEYYLQPAPNALMNLGIEPVQVFRFPGGGNKNAADMRLAMDAMSLVRANQEIEQFILVTGDSDFIPVVLELRTLGVRTVVIGVRGSTKEVFARYCDRFEYFEDLVAARATIDEPTGDRLAEVRAVLHALLAKKRPILFAAVKPLLNNHLKTPFDPAAHSCETTGDFLKRFANELGIAVRRGPSDYEIDRTDGVSEAVLPSIARPPRTLSLPGGAPGGQANGSERPAAAVGGQPSGQASVGDVPLHSVRGYERLLLKSQPAVRLVPPEDWREIAKQVFKYVTDPRTGDRIHFLQEDLLSDVAESCQRGNMQDAETKVRRSVAQFFKAGCFHCADTAPGTTNLERSKPALLAPEIRSPDDLLLRSRGFVVQLLSHRLRVEGESEPPRAEPLCELFYGPDAGPDHASDTRRLLSDPAASSSVGQAPS